MNKPVLLTRNNTGRTHEWLCVISGAVNGGAAVEPVDNIKVFGSTVKLLRDDAERLGWNAEQCWWPENDHHLQNIVPKYSLADMGEGCKPPSYICASKKCYVSYPYLR